MQLEETQSKHTIKEMFPPTKQYYCFSRNPTQSHRFALYRDCQKYGRFTGLCWLMSPELPTVTTLPIPTMDIIWSEEFLQTQQSQQQIDCLVRQKKISGEYIIKISEKWTKKTPNLAFNQRGQINSRQLWLHFEGQMGYSIYFQAPSWRTWFFWS